MANKDNEDILKKKLSKKKKTVDKKSSLVVYCAVNKDSLLQDRNMSGGIWHVLDLKTSC